MAVKPPGRTARRRGKRSGRARPERERRDGGASRKDARRARSAAERTAAAPPPVPAPAHEERAPAPAGPVPADYPIVGIGASAGGLEALERFFRNVPEDSGMAYVVVQHLDPERKAHLVELLQRASRIPIVEVTDVMRAEPNRVHVIPPNRDLSILHGVLHLLVPTSPRSLPIDFFFRALAEDQAEQAIAVVLSGMGTDGTLGLGAVKEKAGATFVQSLASAQFGGMPRSAIEAGHADVVAPVEELPGRILAYHRHASASRADALSDERRQSALDKVFILLRAATGNDFSQYKRSTILRRIERRMGLHQIDRLTAYVRFLRENPKETELLFKELLIGVTSFFRDPQSWEYLSSQVVPGLVAARAGGRVLRAWVPACSTGEEAYSLAILLQEAIEKEAPAKPPVVQIFATDIDADAIERARQGSYPANIAADVSPERLRRFFVQDDRGFRVSKEVRELVVFAPQNVITDPPFTKLDLLSCRNLLIYLAPELQRKLMPLFRYALNPGGVLFLGSAETVGAAGGAFSPLDSKNRVYRRVEGGGNVPEVEFPSAFAPTSAARMAGERPPDDLATGRALPPNLQVLAERMIVQRYAPASVLTTERGDILYFSGRTGKYLEPAVGRANLNLLAMAREGLRYELSSAFAAAVRDDRPVAVHGLRIGTGGERQVVDLLVQRLTEPRDLRGTVMVVFRDVAAGPEKGPEPARRAPGGARMSELERELQQAREEVQTTREEMQTSQEELKSMNEELQSTNEELQSTNEELTTSKEEMQSMNEELQTVNQELQAKVDELSRSNNDMKNLLNSTDVATLFLDGELRVRRYTTPTAKLIKLIPGDTGRPVTDLTSELEYPELAEDAREVLRTLVFKERTAAARDGRWFLVRILPYRTLENVIDGVVITFTDATARKRLEATLREQASEARQLAESLPALAWSARADGAWDALGARWIELTGVPEAEQLGYRWLEQVHPADRERIQEEWRRAVKAGAPFAAELRLRAADGAHRRFLARAAPIRGEGGAVQKWWGTAWEPEGANAGGREDVAGALAGLAGALTEPVLVVDAGRVVRALNAAAERALERGRDEVVGRPVGAVLPGFSGSEGDAKIVRAVKELRTEAGESVAGGGAGARRFEVDVFGLPAGALLVLRARGDVAAAPPGEEIA